MRYASFFLLFASIDLSACSAKATTLDEALTAYHQNRVGEAEAAFSRIAGDLKAPALDRARAFRELARIAWLIDGDQARALAALKSAAATGAAACGTALMQARVLEEAGQREILQSQAAALVGSCPDAAGDRDEIRLHLIRGALDEAASPAVHDQAVRRASGIVDELSADARLSSEGAAARLDVSLQVGDGAAALSAWKDYFWLETEDLPQAMRRAGVSAAKIFAAGLGSGASTPEKLAVLDLLVRGGFAREAEHFRRRADFPADAAANPEWVRLTAYLDVRSDLDRQITASYRKQARGEAADDLTALFARAAERLVSASGVSGERAQVLERAYGLYGQVGKTEGFPSVHYGHLVQDERQTVEQYGRRADVEFKVIDRMLSNGFQSWLWDGTAETGGWTAPGPIIVQVRSGYTSGPPAAWRLFSDPAERARLIQQQPEKATRDAQASAGGTIGFLPALSDRLRLQVAEQVGARARQIAIGGGDLRRAFVQEYWRATFQDAMITHEGRHAIDRQLLSFIARMNDSNLEYRAKIAELALADYPRIALINIDDATTGGDTPHGVANARVLAALGDWIKANPGQVAGFDPSVPAVMQIDKLTDQQIRVAARSLDPLAQ